MSIPPILQMGGPPPSSPPSLQPSPTDCDSLAWILLDGLPRSGSCDVLELLRTCHHADSAPPLVVAMTAPLVAVASQPVNPSADGPLGEMMMPLSLCPKDSTSTLLCGGREGRGIAKRWAFWSIFICDLRMRLL